MTENVNTDEATTFLETVVLPKVEVDGRSMHEHSLMKEVIRNSLFRDCGDHYELKLYSTNIAYQNESIIVVNIGDQYVRIMILGSSGKQSLKVAAVELNPMGGYQVCAEKTHK